jgi:CBS domain-containing protein
MSEARIVNGMAVANLIGDAVACISPDASLTEVADALVAREVGALVVGDADRPHGIVSERDLVRAMAERRSPDTTAAMDVATTELVWCDATASVGEVAEEMSERYVRHVLVEEDGTLIGVVSARDLLGSYAASDVDIEL